MQLIMSGSPHMLPYLEIKQMLHLSAGLCQKQYKESIDYCLLLPYDTQLHLYQAQHASLLMS